MCRTVLTLKTGISQGVLTFWRPPSQTKPKLRNRFKLCDDATGWPGRQINVVPALTILLGSQTVNKLIVSQTTTQKKPQATLHVFRKHTDTSPFLFHRSLYIKAKGQPDHGFADKHCSPLLYGLDREGRNPSVTAERWYLLTLTQSKVRKLEVLVTLEAGQAQRGRWPSSVQQPSGDPAHCCGKAGTFFTVTSATPMM